MNIRFHLTLFIIIGQFIIACQSIPLNPYESAGDRSEFKKVRLPLKDGTSFFVSQGAFGKYSHSELGNEYSWDLAVPYGTEVVAIEAGEVLQVWEPEEGGGCDRKYSELAHNIKIKHEDGSVAQYVHILADVKIGDKVGRGQLIGKTAKNGWICEPHLHFGIYASENNLYGSSERKTLPLRFEGIAGELLVEKERYTVPTYLGEDWKVGRMATAWGERSYYLYLSKKASSRKEVPLLVMLHGCHQQVVDFAESARMNELADSKGFYVLYIEQETKANRQNCWNWFLAKNQSKGAGEPAIIVSVIQEVLQDFRNIDRRRVYISGLSAGGGMASILLACYPEIFAAGAVHSAVGLGLAKDGTQALDVMLNGPRFPASQQQRSICNRPTRPVPLIVVHGEKDPIVVRENAQVLTRQFIKLNDWADDGVANDSLPLKRVEQIIGNSETQAIHRVNYFSQTDSPLVSLLMIEELAHAWSGGAANLPFSDPKTPNVAPQIWDFLSSWKLDG